MYLGPPATHTCGTCAGRLHQTFLRHLADERKGASYTRDSPPRTSSVFSHDNRKPYPRFQAYNIVFMVPPLYGSHGLQFRVQFPKLRWLTRSPAAPLRMVALNCSAVPNLWSLSLGACSHAVLNPEGDLLFMAVSSVDWYSATRRLFLCLASAGSASSDRRSHPSDLLSSCHATRRKNP